MFILSHLLAPYGRIYTSLKYLTYDYLKGQLQQNF